MVAYAVHETGLREVIGLDIGEVESGSFWVEFLRGLQKRGLSGVRLAVSDQHEGLKHAIARVLACRGSGASSVELPPGDGRPAHTQLFFEYTAMLVLRPPAQGDG